MVLLPAPYGAWASITAHIPRPAAKFNRHFVTTAALQELAFGCL